MEPHRKPIHRTRPLFVAFLALAFAPAGLVLADKVREVVVRYDDGTEQVATVNPAKPAPAPGPVNAPPPPPAPGDAALSVRIMTPAVQTVAASPGYFVVRADVTGGTGAPKKVELYAGDKLLDAPTAAPFMAEWSDVKPGTYDLFAKVYDAQGGVTTSAPVRVTVVAPRAGREIVVAPGQQIAAAIAQAQPGDTVRVPAGQYQEAVVVSRGGTPEAPLRIAFDPNATLDATAFPHALIPGNAAANVIVTGLHVIGCTNEKQGQNAAVRTGNGWRLEDCVVERTKNTGIGVLGIGVTLLRCTARENGQNGISSAKGKQVLMKDCVIQGNNTARHNPASEGGGGKWARTDTVYVTNLRTFDNIGPGLWFDISNKNYVVTRSFAWGNQGKNADWEGAAFSTEISQGPGRFEKNVTWDNTGAGVNVAEAQDLTVQDNTFVNDTVHLRNLLRKDGTWHLDNVVIRGNRFKNGYIDTSDAGESWRTGRAAEWRLTIDGNTYDRQPGQYLAKWGKRKLTTLDEVRQTLGIEQGGIVGAVPAPEKPAAAALSPSSSSPPATSSPR